MKKKPAYPRDKEKSRLIQSLITINKNHNVNEGKEVQIEFPNHVEIE